MHDELLYSALGAFREDLVHYGFLTSAWPNLPGRELMVTGLDK